MRSVAVLMRARESVQNAPRGVDVDSFLEAMGRELQVNEYKMNRLREAVRTAGRS